MSNNTTILLEVGGINYILRHADVYIPYLILYTIGVLIGLTGNFIIMGTIVITKELHNPTNILVFNLGLADILISGFVDSTTIVGVLVGKRMFDSAKHLCDFVAAICLVACITSMVNIGFLAINRYINICYNAYYNKIFTTKKTIIYCIVTWCIGIIIDTPNFVGWGRHTYDIDTLSCLWDRRASHSYTLFFPLTSIIIPCICVALCYWRIFVFVRNSKHKINAIDSNKDRHAKDRAQSIKFAKALFASFLIFTICWLPYGLVVMTDWYYTYPSASIIFTLLLAHLNSALNPIFYGVYNITYRKGYRSFVRLLFGIKTLEPTKTTQMRMNHTVTNCNTLQKMP